MFVSQIVDKQCCAPTTRRSNARPDIGEVIGTMSWYSPYACTGTGKVLVQREPV